MIEVVVFFLQIESGKKTLVLHGTKTSSVLNAVLTQIYHLKKESAVKYSRKNDNIKPFEAGGETSLEFFSQKTDCNLQYLAGNSCYCYSLVTSYLITFYYLVIPVIEIGVSIDLSPVLIDTLIN
jgi:hypothetical protein